MNYFLCIFLLLLIACSPKAEPTPRWLIGYWAMTLTDSGKLVVYTVEFTKDGSYIDYSQSCQPVGYAPFQYRKGNVYIKRTKPNKEVIKVLLVPNKDQTELIYVSKITGKRLALIKSKACVPSQS